MRRLIELRRTTVQRVHRIWGRDGIKQANRFTRPKFAVAVLDGAHFRLDAGSAQGRIKGQFALLEPVPRRWFHNEGPLAFAGRNWIIVKGMSEPVVQDTRCRAWSSRRQQLEAARSECRLLAIAGGWGLHSRLPAFERYGYVSVGHAPSARPHSSRNRTRRRRDGRR